ncbi:MarC family protein [Komagataeibacter sp. FNDCF1]|uniref:MarC family protein n=1 Tax=Komagataeibacter sp. FNDCF1 TaxID=2878681 RepID=UPI001E58CE35|nr:MarC family protein [Komagataeibacter sp. FNDCF1]MCE2566011.1 MarC family protein [Komagataeibacter sp. FNDCF1]
MTAHAGLLTHFSTVVGLPSLSGAFLMAFPALFSIVNPLGAALIFAQVTGGQSRRTCVALARQVAFYSAVLMLASIWVGGLVLSFFGITIDALRIAGGLVVAVRAWSLLQAPETEEARKQAQGSTVQASANIMGQAFFPLTMPFAVGPGTIAVAIALGSEGPPTGNHMVFYAVLSLAGVLVAAIVWAAYTYADQLLYLLGTTGTRIVSRLAALILLSIGVQILITGVQGVILSSAHAVLLMAS